MFEFKRKILGGVRRDGHSPDLSVSAVPSGKGSRHQWQISFRLNKRAMEKLRLLHSDRVTATFDPATGNCMITRVADDSGNRISTRQSKGGSTGQVRFSCSPECLAELGLLKDGKRVGSIAADLVGEEGRTAIFAISE